MIGGDSAWLGWSCRVGGGADVWTKPALEAGAVSDVPHSLQNFAPGGFSVSQAGQRDASGVPHALQNFASGAFSCWHWGHCIPPSHAYTETIALAYPARIVASRGTGLKRKNIVARWVAYNCSLGPVPAQTPRREKLQRVPLLCNCSLLQLWAQSCNNFSGSNTTEMTYPSNASNNPLASFRSAVSNPSVNHPYTGASRS